MQRSTSGGGSGGGGGGVGRGLARFRSAPATWLEALLESDIEQEEEDEEEEDPLLKPPTQFQTQLKPTTQFPPTSYAEPASFDGAGGPASGVGFLRHNSTPADFLAQISGGTDGYFSSFGIPTSYDYSASSVDVAPSSKRPKEADSAKFSSQLKVEPTGMNGLLDAEMEKLLEDSVPCRVRAKRGCATHPRSIAERVRRTRISDRIRKLQELVPNMDKQTNTADMLEEAVEYVKLLQKQIQVWIGSPHEVKTQNVAGTQGAAEELHVPKLRVIWRIYGGLCMLLWSIMGFIGHSGSSGIFSLHVWFFHLLCRIVLDA